MPKPETPAQNPPPRPVIGLLGGVGSGKSLVASQFAQLGCAVVDADRIAHAVLADAAVREAIRHRFGGEYLDTSGSVDRARLGQKVFANPADREALEALVHPEIGRRLERELAEARSADVPAVVLDAPLILEKGLDSRCDFMLYIEVPEETRQARIGHGRGWGPSEIARREASQVSLKTKQDRADFTVDNSASPDHTFDQIREILSRVVT